jgi:hypothetical protein
VPDLIDSCALLEAHTVEMVQLAPEIDRALVETAAVAALQVAALAGDGDLIRLALVIERVVDDLAEGEIALGVGLPALAMAAYTLHAAAAARGAHDPLAVRASTYELDTLTPVPVAPPARRVDGAAQRRRQRVWDGLAADVLAARARYAR